MKWRWLGIFLAAIVTLILLLWLSRARLASELTQAYFRSHSITSTISIDAFGLSGISGRFTLGPQDVPEISAERIELHFDPLSWTPMVAEIELVNPVIRARLDENGVITLPSLQQWIDSLQSQQGRSRFVSEELAVSLNNLRVHLGMPGGALAMTGDVRLVDGSPVSMAMRVMPASITYKETSLNIRAASLSYDKSDGGLTLRYSGTVQNPRIKAENVEAALFAQNLRWMSADNRLAVLAPNARLQFSAQALTMGQAFSTPSAELLARDISLSLQNGSLEGRADWSATGSAGFDAGALASLRALDPALANAVARNLARLDFSLAAHVEKRGTVTNIALTAPLEVKGARGAVLRVPMFELEATSAGWQGQMDASLAGGGIPSVKIQSRDFVLADGTLAADATLGAQFNFAMLRGASLAASGRLSWRGGQYAFTPSSCARITLSAFRPGAADTARSVRGDVCGLAGSPLVAGEGTRWNFSGQGRNVAAFLPLANARLDNGAGRLSFAGDGGDFSGKIALTAARLSDQQDAARFRPMLGNGAVTLAGGVWRGQITATDSQKHSLGEIRFSHVMARGTGTANITASNLAFSPGAFQPEHISPLLEGFRQAAGSARFTGEINWTRNTLESRGELAVDGLNFLTPLGEAQSIKTMIVFSSLLPPITADNQSATVSKVDWTLPFSTMDLKFSFSPTAIHFGGIDTDVAEGHVKLGAFTIDLSKPGPVEGKAEISSIALSQLVAASNLGSKFKLDGKVSGQLPFTFGPDGFRVTNGQITADGAGRLSIDHSLWTEEGFAANAVQDFAYQAMEYLAFDKMTASVNSIDNGRLQIIFHITGRSDPPKPQTAEIAIADLIDGSVLQKNVLLPSGTVIDLTLDVSLNFDELLKSYVEAWSNTLGQADPARRTTQ